ncbi:DNA cytosine methyltransferase [Pseudomonas sp. ESBL1]|uniref:DNA cytosine methyltransferase n=1 Tax=Pseudomonas sp. ESBL1 TaxID=3077324 RepID=UPI002FC61D25
MPITYGSVCSGIEAATVAWHVLAWKAAWYAEIEPFPSAVLAYHYPETPNHGDMTRLAAMVLSGKIPAPEVLVGGTPCQAFSVAGMREGLADPRGALTIKYVELFDAIDHVRTMHGQPEAVCLWENVPGVLSDKGNAFGCFLGALVGESEELQPPGGKWKDAGCVYGPTRTAAWRVLDAQYFGLAQRRRRVFVVASARAGFDPLEVLFEREGVRRDTPPRRGEGQDLAGRAPFGPALQCGCGWVYGLDLGQYGCPNCEGDEGPAVEVLAGVPAYGGHGLHGDVSQAATLTAKDTRLDIESETFCIHGTQDPDLLLGVSHTLGRNNGAENALFEGQGIRRLTPKEFERLQGFSDTYTRIPYRGKPADECPDGPRYKAIGNSKAVFVVRWIGRRIQQQLERLD